MSGTMEVHLIVMREKEGGQPWVRDAWDEFSIEENEPGWLDAIKAAEESGHDVRTVVVVLPADALSSAFGPLRIIGDKP